MIKTKMMLFEELDRKLSRKEAIKKALKETPKELSKDKKLLKPSITKSVISIATKAPRSFYRRLKTYAVDSKESNQKD